jgi:hypothetical protein
MLFENKFLRILSLGPPTGSKPFGLAVIILVTRHSEVGGQKSCSGRLVLASSEWSAIRTKVERNLHYRDIHRDMVRIECLPDLDVAAHRGARSKKPDR